MMVSTGHKHLAPSQAEILIPHSSLPAAEAHLGHNQQPGIKTVVALKWSTMSTQNHAKNPKVHGWDSP